MRIGFFGANVAAMASREAADVAVAAEELGYASLWVAEHVVVPTAASTSPLAPHRPVADPLVMLGFLAARTSRIELRAGVLVLPQHQPVRLAKQAASLDIVSSGRFVLGVGIGHVEREFGVLGVPMERRRARFREYVAAVRELWVAQAPSFDGEFVSFAGVDAHPRPSTPGGPRLVLGGDAEAARHDAATLGSGWYGFGLTPSDARDVVADLRGLVVAAGRDPEEFEVSLTPPVRLTPDLVAEYAAAGVDQLVISGESETIGGVMRRLELNAPAVWGL